MSTDYTKAISLQPNDPVTYNNRAAIYIKENNFDKAMEDLTQAIKLSSNVSAYYYTRGLIYKFKNDKDNAIADFKMVVKLKGDPMAVEQLNMLGIKDVQ